MASAFSLEGITKIMIWSISFIRSVLAILLFIMACWCSPLLARTGDVISILLTADGEGHARPCSSCPGKDGLGGLSRRATVVHQLRHKNPATLFLDAGNALFGNDSLESRGEVIVDAYSALNYDAVNLSYRDFFFGKKATERLIKQGSFPFLSANIIDDRTTEPLVLPYVVKDIGGRRVAVIGVSSVPAGFRSERQLAHLKEQLAGLRFEEPVEALEKWLPKAKAAADRVFLLYYGSAFGLRSIREKFGADLDAILVGGIRPDYLPKKAIPPLIATSIHGQHLAVAAYSGTGVDIKQVAIEPTIEPDPEMQELIAEYVSVRKRLSPSPAVKEAAKQGLSHLFLNLISEGMNEKSITSLPKSSRCVDHLLCFFREIFPRAVRDRSLRLMAARRRKPRPD